jgi:hypothetical protein
MKKLTKLAPCGILASLTAISGALLTAPSARADDSSGAANGQSVAHVESSDTAPSIPRLDVSVSGAYFDLQGSRSANNNLYSFGNYTLSAEDIKLQYTVAPGWSIMLLAQYLSYDVTINIGPASIPFTPSGLGDTLLEAVHPLLVSSHFFIVADAGVSVPTGSINEANPVVPQLHDAYFLQLGSGTFDGVFGVTSLYHDSLITVGNRLFAEERNGDNSNGYHLGNLYKADGWLDVPLKYGFTPRITGYYRLRGAITGWDPTLPPQPLTEYYYHHQSDWDVAAAIRYQHAVWNKVSVVAEADLPFYQGMSNSDNIALRMNYYGTLSLTGQF